MPAGSVRSFRLLSYAAFIGAGLHSSSHATEYSLPDLISLGLQRNGSLDEATWQIRGAEAQLRKARAAFVLPRLRLQTRGGLVPEAKGDVFNPTSDTTGLRPLGPFSRTDLEILQPLFTFGQLTSMRRAAEGGVALKRAELDEARVQVAFDIQELFYGVLLAQDLKGLVQRLVDEISERQVELEDDLASSLSATYKLKLAMLELERQEREASSSVSLGLGALAWKAGISPDSTLTLSPGSLEIAPADLPALETLIEEAFRRRPDWQQLQAGITATAALVDAARSRYYPQFFAAGGLRYAIAPNRTDQHNPFVVDNFNFFNVGAFVGVRQSFEWQLLTADLDKARAEHLGLKAKEAPALQGIRLDVQRAHDQTLRLLDDMNERRERRRLTRQWLKLAKEEYEFDPDEIDELIPAYEAWALAEQAYYEAIFSFNVSTAKLARTIGRTTLTESENGQSLETTR